MKGLQEGNNTIISASLQAGLIHPHRTPETEDWIELLLRTGLLLATPLMDWRTVHGAPPNPDDSNGTGLLGLICLGISLVNHGLIHPQSAGHIWVGLGLDSWNNFPHYKSRDSGHDQMISNGERFNRLLSKAIRRRP